MLAIFVLFLFSALFWSGFEQAGSSLNLFARDLTDRVIGGWEMPVSWLQSVNPLFIIAFAPVFAWLWLRLRRREPSAPAKFSLGLIFLGLGFGVMVWASMLTVGPNGQAIKVSPLWLVMTYLFHTFGELCLSPVGLSTVTKLAPHRIGQPDDGHLVHVHLARQPDGGRWWRGSSRSSPCRSSSAPSSPPRRAPACSWRCSSSPFAS